MILTDRFGDALSFAERLHRLQTRKGSQIPYIAHLLAVASMALEWGADEDTAIAALLHDAVEDQGGLEVAVEIRARFGERVADIVMACSDSTSGSGAAKRPWRLRKEEFLSRLADAPLEVAVVVFADKLHNLRALVGDVRREGPKTLQRFNSPEELLWYYERVAAALRRYSTELPVFELFERLQQLEALLYSERPGCGRARFQRHG